MPSHGGRLWNECLDGMVGVCFPWWVCQAFSSPSALPSRSEPNRQRSASPAHTVPFIAVLLSIWKLSLQNVVEILKK